MTHGIFGGAELGGKGERSCKSCKPDDRIGNSQFFDKNEE